METVTTFFESSEVNFESVKNLFQQPQPQTFLDEVNAATQLSWSRRIIFFGICFILGVAFVFISTFFLFLPRTFAKFYTFGNLFMMGSTLFLVGPCQQLKNMFSRERFLSSIIYILAMFGTLYAALVLNSWMLAIFLSVIQMLATVWYAASYIPYGQNCLLGAFSSVRSLSPV